MSEQITMDQEMLENLFVLIEANEMEKKQIETFVLEFGLMPFFSYYQRFDFSNETRVKIENFLNLINFTQEEKNAAN